MLPTYMDLEDLGLNEFSQWKKLSASSNTDTVAFVDAVEGLTAPKNQSTGFCNCIS